jgi:cell division septal protein FtsQ
MRTDRKRLDRGRRSPSIYSRTESQKENRSFGWLFYFFFLILLGAFVYLIFFSPVFRINEKSIEVIKYVNENEIKTRLSQAENNFFNGNLLTYNTGNLQSKIGEIAGVKSAKVTKVFPHKLKIQITERTPSFSWETIGKKYLVDDGGIVTGDFEDRFKDFPTVVDSKNISISVGKQVVSSDFPVFIKDLNDNFNTYTGANITKIEVPEITSEIRVDTDAKWYVYFDTTRTAKNQLMNLSRVLSEAKSKKKKLEYIDLRIDNRIFYQ